jgi:hypothetical protein
VALEFLLIFSDLEQGGTCIMLLPQACLPAGAEIVICTIPCEKPIHQQQDGTNFRLLRQTYARELGVKLSKRVNRCWRICRARVDQKQ